MRFAVLVTASVLLPTAASAGSLVAGVSAGALEAEHDTTGSAADRTIGVFGRLGLGDRLAVQLELAQGDRSVGTSEYRLVTGLIVVDLAARGTVIPTLFGGVGAGSGRSSYGITHDAAHAEAGIGLEYRSASGFVIGGDVRIGERAVDQSTDNAILDVDTRAIYIAPPIDAGRYHAARFTLGVRF